MHATTIVGYTFNADTYCPGCIVSALPTGGGQAFDGWALADGVRMDPEDDLSEIAQAFGIDRFDEPSYDSSEFPKVIFASQVNEDEEVGPEYCAVCLEPLVD